jgi:hypothetical protein
MANLTEFRRKALADKAKCSVCALKGQTVLATSASVARGEALCFRHDPKWKRAKPHKRVRPPKPSEQPNRIGKRDDVMPEELLEGYELAILDKEYTSLRENIATNEARERYLLQTIRDSPKNSPNFIKHLASIIRQGNIAIKRHRRTHEQVLKEVTDVIEGGVEMLNLWHDYDEIAERKRKLIDSETKRLLALGWSPDKVDALIHEIGGILVRLEVERLLSVDEFYKRLAKSRLFNTGALSLLPSETVSSADVASQLTTLEDNRPREINITPVTPAPSVDTEAITNNLDFLEEN